MSIISRARALGAASALALGAPTLFNSFLLAAQKADAGDIKLLDTVIPLERAALKAYADAAASKLLSPAVLAVTQTFMADHQAHLDALVAAVVQSGATASPDTATLTPPELKTEADILGFAYTVERLAAATYLGTVAQFKNREFATTAASIMGVDVTHVALLAEALKKNPAYPTSFVTA